jgi:hypothetical protein
MRQLDLVEAAADGAELSEADLLPCARRRSVSRLAPVGRPAVRVLQADLKPKLEHRRA